MDSHVHMIELGMSTLERSRYLSARAEINKQANYRKKRENVLSSKYVLSAKNYVLVFANHTPSPKLL